MMGYIRTVCVCVCVCVCVMFTSLKPMGYEKRVQFKCSQSVLMKSCHSALSPYLCLCLYLASSAFHLFYSNGCQVLSPCFYWLGPKCPDRRVPLSSNFPEDGGVSSDSGWPSERGVVWEESPLWALSPQKLPSSDNGLQGMARDCPGAPTEPSQATLGQTGIPPGTQLQKTFVAGPLLWGCGLVRRAGNAKEA